MKLYLTDQSTDFDKQLDVLLKKSIMPYSKTALKEKVTSVEVTVNKKFNKIDTGFLFNYTIFPAHIMTSKTQWGKEHREMKVGDTLVQQVFIPPSKIFSLKLIFGVRINAIINEESRKGFSYETLEGHVERVCQRLR